MILDNLALHVLSVVVFLDEVVIKKVENINIYPLFVLSRLSVMIYLGAIGTNFASRRRSVVRRKR